MLRLRAGVAAGVLVSVWAAVAAADGFDAQRFQPSAGAAGGFIIERANVADHLGWGLGLFLHYADDPVVETDQASGDVVSRPLDSALTFDLIASIGLFDLLEIAAHLPINAVYEGDGLTADGQGLAPGAGLGDLRLVPKAQLVRTRGRSMQLTLGLAAPITLPTGNDLEMRGAGGVTIEPRILLGFLGRRFGLHLSGGFLVDTGDPPESLAVGNELTFGLALTFALARSLDLTLEGAAGLYLEDGEGSQLPLEVLGGLIWRPHPDWQVYGGAGPGLTSGIGTPDFRVIFGVRWTPQREGTSTYVDRDDDGIADAYDRCPRKAEDEDGFKDEDGCPEADNDGDRIGDDEDECPDDPEEPGGDGDGCPDRGRIIVSQGEIVIIGKIQFETDSDRIQKKSDHLLDQIADALRDHEKLRVRVEGHSDSQGDAGYNQKLSQERAQSVKRALVERGIPARRLEARGYGETTPRAPNRTRAGRAKNRRVEFRVVD